MSDQTQRERPWDRYLASDDRDILKLAGYTSKMGFGDRPAVLVIDANYNFCGDRDEPVRDAIKRWPNACGHAAWAAIPHIQNLLGAARDRGLPVIYTTGGFREDGWDYGSWKWKYSRVSDEIDTSTRNRDGNEIVEEIAPVKSDLVVTKLKPSAFFGTALQAHLVQLKADSLIVCGVSTSGCVRATVTDGFSLNYRVAVAEDACFDRSEISHAVNLMDLDAKYADVMPTSEIVDHVLTLPQGAFDLPSDM